MGGISFVPVGALMAVVLTSAEPIVLGIVLKIVSTYEPKRMLTRSPYTNITSFYGSSCANNGKDAVNTPDPEY
eukprot:1409661-Pyramimonas_sp.AAC.3